MLAPPISKQCGRNWTSILFHYTGTGMLFAISYKMPVIPCLVLVLTRNGIMNGNTPLQTAIVMECVSKEHRGKWSSISSLKGMMWSGSAFLGGWMSDSHDYRFAFFVTACVHVVAGSFMLPLSPLLKRMQLTP